MTDDGNRCILRGDRLFAVTYYKSGRTRNRVLFRVDREGNVLFKDPTTDDESCIGSAVISEDQVVVVFKRVHVEQ